MIVLHHIKINNNVTTFYLKIKFVLQILIIILIQQLRDKARFKKRKKNSV